MWALVEGPQKWVSKQRTVKVEMGRAWPFTNKPHSYVGYYSAEFHRCWSNGTSVRLSRSAGKKTGFLVSRLSGPLKIIESDTDRSGTSDFLFHSYHGIILYRFQNIAILAETCEFFLPIPIYHFAKGQRDHNRYSLNTWSNNANYVGNWVICYFTLSLIPLSDAAQLMQRVSHFAKESGMLGLQNWSRSRGQLSAVSVLVSSSRSMVSVSVSVSCV